MGAAELLAKLGADARVRADAIRTEQEQAVRELAARAEAEVARLRAEAQRRTELEIERTLERARGRARLAVRNAALAARRQVLQRVKSVAEQRVLEDAGYTALLTGLIARHATEAAVVQLSVADTQRIGGTLRPKPADPVPISGGVIIRSGRVARSFVLRDTIEELSEVKSAELGRILFGS